MMGDRELRDPGVRVHRAADLGEQLRCGRSTGSLVDHVETSQHATASLRVAQEDVLRHGLVRGEVELLVDHRDAEVLCLRWVVDLDDLPVDSNLASVTLMRSGKDLDE